MLTSAREKLGLAAGGTDLCVDGALGDGQQGSGGLPAPRPPCPRGLSASTAAYIRGVKGWLRLERFVAEICTGIKLTETSQKGILLRI